MEDPGPVSSAGGGKKGKQWIIWLSYATDWIILLITAGIGYVMGHVSPNMRPFSLTDPNISYVN